MNVVQSLWIGESLGRMEVACIKSFLRLGYEYHLYTYDDLANIPEGTTILDGNEILSKERIFKYQGPKRLGGGSYSGFSNYFRFNLLRIKGGIWVDADVYCLKRLPKVEDYLLVRHDDRNITAGIIQCPVNCEFANYCCEVCDSKDPNVIIWGETGPRLVKKAVKELGLGELVRPHEMFFPIHWVNLRRFLENTPLGDAYTIHFWNEEWRRRKVDKNAVYDKNCLYEKLLNFRMNKIKFM
ncbi:MAG: hypothetical protein DWQ19_10230 [Crenarchaeota archaeon]|nr:MAG: hypothetical protein DWQ19_10230 [Thermoproteota archaeon]